MNVKIKLFDEKYLPVFKHEVDACADCKARLSDPVVLKKGERKLIPLGFCIEVPIFFEGVIRPRSGNSLNGIDVIEGTIDCGYTGEVMADIVNNSDDEFKICDGDRICQLAIREAPPVEFKIVQDLDASERGTAGFGSTGIK